MKTNILNRIIGLKIIVFFILMTLNDIFCQATDQYTIIFNADNIEKQNNNHPQKVQSVNFKDCYSRSSVSGSDNTGGLIGKVSSNSVIQNTYSAGLVTSSGEQTGGLLGNKDESATIENSYWDTQSTEQNYSAGGEGRQTADLTYPYSAGSYTNWNFTHIWSSDAENINHGYPYLKNAAPQTFNLAVATNNPEYGSTSGSGKFSQYTKTRIRAVAKPEFIFSHWTDPSGATISEDSNYIYTMTGSNTTLTAHFEAIYYQLSIQVHPPESGTVNGIGDFRSGDTIHLNAQPNTGYVFNNWTNNDGFILSEANPYIFFMPSSNLSLIANFKTTTSVSDEWLKNVNIHPNPFSDMLYIENAEHVDNISIYNVFGQCVKNWDNRIPEYLDVKELLSGIYFVSLRKDNAFKVIKLIKH